MVFLRDQKFGEGIREVRKMVHLRIENSELSNLNSGDGIREVKRNGPLERFKFGDGIREVREMVHLRDLNSGTEFGN